MAAAVKSRNPVSRTFKKSANVTLYQMNEALGTLKIGVTIPAGTMMNIKLAGETHDFGSVESTYHPAVAVVKGKIWKGFIHDHEIPCGINVLC